MISINKLQVYIFAVVILLQIYVPSFKFNTFLQLFLLIFVVEKKTISIKTANLILPIILLIFIGFIGMFVYSYKSYNIIKDILHFIKPLIAFFIGYFIFKKVDNLKTFVKIIVQIAFVSSLIHFFIIFFVNSSLSNVSSIREYSKDNFLELFALFMFIFYKKFYQDSLLTKKLTERIFFIIILASSVLYFSRTMMVIAVIITLTAYGFTIITRKTLKIIGIITLFILALYVVLFSVKIQRNKDGFESFLYKLKIAPAEIFKTNIDRENHANLWDHWRGYEANRALSLLNEKPESYIIGNGYGSLVNLKFFAPLSNTKKGLKYISELHNGYIYILYKTGIFGLFIYLLWLYVLYKTIYFRFNFTTVFVSAISVSLMFSSLVVGSVFNCDPIFMFLLGVFLYFNEKQNLIKND